MKMKFALKAIAITLFMNVVNCALGSSSPQMTEVFRAGKDPFSSIRIPSLLPAKNGALLAIAEGRAANSDQAENKIILKRSTDGGTTWGALQVIADDGSNCLNNPCSVLDERTGRIIVMFQRYPANHRERDGSIKPGLNGPDITRNYVIHSDDDGASWSQPVDVTGTTKPPGEETIMASGPGIGIQLTHGAQAGRIIIPFNEGTFGRWKVLAVFSDDDGNHWHIGEPAPGCCITNEHGKVIGLVNEVQMVELSDGSVMLNSRNWGGPPVRKTAISHDGGFSWSDIENEPSLRDPGCMASLFRARSQPGPDVLLYCGPNSRAREMGTVHLSRDDGKTWPVQKILFPGSFAYSCLAQLPNGDIGCLYEADEASRMMFARFTLDWLNTP